MKLYYSIIEDSFNHQGLLNILNGAIEKNADTVILLADTEWDIPNLTKQIVFEFKNNNIKLQIVFCSNKNDYYTKWANDIGLEIENVIFWGTYWINWSLENLRWVSDFKNNTFDVENLKYPFITLNNRSHIHRCIFIDEMAKQNLIDKGIVTWVKHLNENRNYPYQYFDNKQLLLSDDFATKLDSFLLPKEFNQSLFHAVTEATHITDFISEKTAIPLFMKKPFFVLSAPYFHKSLTELGFVLYDEVIDYSFDSIEDLQLRTKHFVDNLQKVCDLNYIETYKLLYPKILHNYNRAIEITKDISLIPDIIKDKVNSNIDYRKLNEARYITFINNTKND